MLDGNRLEMSPDHIISWGATVKPVPAVTATFDVKHVGGVMVDEENTFESIRTRSSMPRCRGS